MKIRWSLSGFIKGAEHIYDDIYSPEFKKFMIGKPIYVDRYKEVGHVTDVDPESDCIYGEITNKEYSELILDSKGYNKCGFEIVKGE